MREEKRPPVLVRPTEREKPKTEFVPGAKRENNFQEQRAAVTSFATS